MIFIMEKVQLIQMSMEVSEFFLNKRVPEDIFRKATTDYSRFLLQLGIS